MILYGYWRSSASWRVRIGLHLKGLAFETRPVNLLESAQVSPAHRARNPMGQVPALQLEDGTFLTQSLPILRYLDRVHPSPALHPADPLAEAHATALAEIVNAGTQPLQNLPLLKHIASIGGDRTAWGREVIEKGLAAFQDLSEQVGGVYAAGDSVTVADLTLIPQLYNARRFGCDLSPLGRLLDIEARCSTLPAFEAAHPDQQPDANPA